MATRYLIVEDEPAHAEFLSMTIVEFDPDARIDHVSDADEAIALLDRIEAEDGHPAPDIAMVDLKLRMTSGFEVVGELKQRPRFASIPVIVLSSSEADPDRRQALALRADSYLVKPMDYQAFRAMVREVVMRVTRPVLGPGVEGSEGAPHPVGL